MSDNKMRSKTFLFLLLIWIAATLLNITKAVHIDDTAYLEISQHIMQEPLRPMSGMLNWSDIAEPIHLTNNPLLIPYIYAVTMSIFGESEAALHAVMSLFSLAAMVFFYLLARRLEVKNAILLTAVYSLGPVFIPSQNLMLDVPIAALWLAFFWLILWPEPEQNSPVGHAMAAVVCGIACLTKYVSIVLIPILALDIALRRKWNRIWVTGIPILLLAGWSSMNYLDYGGVHLFSREVGGLGLSRIGKSCLEWILCLGAISPFSLWLLPYWAGRKNGRAYLAVCALLSGATVLVGLFYLDGIVLRAVLRGLFWGSGTLLLFTALLLLMRTLVDQILSNQLENGAFYACLLAWVSGGALFIILFAPFVAVRHLIMVVPAILLVSGKFVLPELRKPWIYGGLVATISLGVLLGISDWKHADVYRSSAQEIRDLLGKDSTLWHRGHWGWHWYAKKAGIKQYDMADTVFRKGDYLVTPHDVHKQNLRKTQAPQLKQVRIIRKSSDWNILFRTMGGGAGYYKSDLYHNLPWNIEREENIFFIDQAITDREAIEWTAAEGLLEEEGPYPQWGLPVVRWGSGTQTGIIFEADGQPLVLFMTCGKHHLEWQEIAVSLNGEQIGQYRFDIPDEFKDIRLPLTPRNGRNVLTIGYQNQDETFPGKPMALLFKQIQILWPEMAGIIISPGPIPLQQHERKGIDSRE
jgi:4-amino-4-deoxy-L-arabinose transferase-like glycosyltransferase